jgi:hypothetical protein
MPTPFYSPSPFQTPIPNRAGSINPANIHSYVASTPLKNEEERWLETFQKNYLTDSIKKSQETGKIDAPLRQLRQKIHEALGLIDKMKMAATEIMALETKLQSDSSTEMHSLEISRVRLQFDVKRQLCEQLKNQLEAMNASSLFYSKQKITFIRKFTKQIQDKKVNSPFKNNTLSILNNILVGIPKEKATRIASD